MHDFALTRAPGGVGCRVPSLWRKRRRLGPTGIHTHARALRLPQ